MNTYIEASLLLGSFLLLLFLLSFTGAHRFIPALEYKGLKRRGVNLCFLILIRPGITYRDSTIAHEREHSRQWWRLGILGFRLVYMTKRGRLWAESHAYAQSVLRGRPIDECAQQLSRNYGLDISVDVARREIENAFSKAHK